ncbi:5-oxoprolinase, partial [Excalfactoria chinensis]|uniref:5-oxoprolinase n=1 Tax=Excalfactoria chinensis TaxID=46218 RepID=UPI003B3B6720
MSVSAGFQFSIDRGGTFTDVFARCPDGRVRVLKLLSEDPKYDDAPTEGIRRVLRECGVPVPPRGPLDGSLLQWIRMGTTVATNALLQRRGDPIVLLVTRGFRDLLHIGTQARPDIFDLSVRCPPPLYEAVIEVDERLIPVRSDCKLPGCETMETVRGRSGQQLLVLKAPDLSALRAELQLVWERGVRSVAVLLLHSYTCPTHEELVGSLVRSMGFTHVSLSSSLSGMARAVPRGMTACADAYLSPTLHRYLHSFQNGFTDRLKSVPVLFMRSDGGLTPLAEFSGSQAVLSGPAGGVLGFARTAWKELRPRPVIGFDMG